MCLLDTMRSDHVDHVYEKTWVLHLQTVDAFNQNTKWRKSQEKQFKILM